MENNSSIESKASSGMTYPIVPVSKLTARQLFRKYYHSKHNILTPDTLRCEKIGTSYAVELSRGRDMDNHAMYGVTVISIDSTSNIKAEFNLSKCFTGENAHTSAIHYIRELHDKYLHINL